MESGRQAGKAARANKTLLLLGTDSEIDTKILEYLENKEFRKALTEEVEVDFTKGDCDAIFRKVVVGDWEPPATESSTSDDINELEKQLQGKDSPALHYGHLAFRGIWEHDLKMKYKIDYLQKASTKITTWKLSDLLFYLCTLRIIEPCSYHSSYELRDEFFYCPWGDIALDNYYKALDFVEDNMDLLLKQAVKQRYKEEKLDVRVAFFDCTNTWFETPYDDRTWATFRYINKVSDAMRKNNKSEKEIDSYLASEEFDSELEKYLSSQQEQHIRMRGPSKEGRYSQPIVTVALAIDQEGFPIDFKVFAGNISELKTLVPVLDSLREKYNVKDVYFIADRGLNSTENIDEIQKRGLGYIVAQKVSGQKANEENEMLDLTGYKNCIQNNGSWTVCEGNINEEMFRYKVCERTKSCYIAKEDGTLLKNGKSARKKITVPCKIMYTFCPKRKKHDLMELQNNISRAQQAINKGILMGNPNSSGWRALIKTEKEKLSSEGNDINIYRAVELKQDIIDKRTKLAGYAAYIFSHPQNNKEHEISDSQILSTYHRLVAIEDCFRTMKSNFSIRPVHVRLYKRIKGHCGICVLSLFLLRALQAKLNNFETNLTTEKLIKILKSAYLIPVKRRNDIIFITSRHRLGLVSTKLAGKGKFPVKENDLDDTDTIWRRYCHEKLSSPPDLDIIMRAAGLEKPQSGQSLGKIKRTLKMSTLPDSAIMSKLMRNYIGITATIF